jgi:hypothetical protein
MRDIEFTGQCDFCPSKVEFYRVTHDGGFWSLASFEANAGSDYLAIWCASCGPKHREGNRFFPAVTA